MFSLIPLLVDNYGDLTEANLTIIIVGDGMHSLLLPFKLLQRMHKLLGLLLLGQLRVVLDLVTGDVVSWGRLILWGLREEVVL